MRGDLKEAVCERGGVREVVVFEMQCFYMRVVYTVLTVRYNINLL